MQKNTTDYNHFVAFSLFIVLKILDINVHPLLYKPLLETYLIRTMNIHFFPRLVSY